MDKVAGVLGGSLQIPGLWQYSASQVQTIKEGTQIAAALGPLAPLPAETFMQFLVRTAQNAESMS